MRWVLFLFLCLICALPVDVQAHESRPLYIGLTEIQDDVFDLVWTSPNSVGRGNEPMIEGRGCAFQSEYRQIRVSGGASRQGVWDCADGLSQISISYPLAAPSMSSLVRVEYLSGQVYSDLLKPGELSWDVPEEIGAVEVALDYTILGVEHIWLGLDHLLFVMCLVLIAGTGRRIFITVTGFTIAHSITLSLSTLGVLTIPVAPVEAVVALSIVFLAVEIARGQRDSITWRYPVAVSSSFGLLHGFGFASVLKEIGLPNNEIINALLFFNVGVEIGQVAFILAIIAAMWAFARLSFNIPRSFIERPLVYLIGVVSVYWMCERIADFVL